VIRAKILILLMPMPIFEMELCFRYIFMRAVKSFTFKLQYFEYRLIIFFKY